MSANVKIMSTNFVNLIHPQLFVIIYFSIVRIRIHVVLLSFFWETTWTWRDLWKNELFDGRVLLTTNAIYSLADPPPNCEFFWISPLTNESTFCQNYYFQPINFQPKHFIFVETNEGVFVSFFFSPDQHDWLAKNDIWDK